MKKFIQYTRENHFEIKKAGVEKFKMPLYVFYILFVLSFQFCTILMLIGLFFNLEYSFSGPYPHENMNWLFGKLSEIVNTFKTDLQKE